MVCVCGRVLRKDEIPFQIILNLCWEWKWGEFVALFMVWKFSSQRPFLILVQSSSG
jgi:hypothetical protein